MSVFKKSVRIKHTQLLLSRGYYDTRRYWRMSCSCWVQILHGLREADSNWCWDLYCIYSSLALKGKTSRSLWTPGEIVIIFYFLFEMQSLTFREYSEILSVPSGWACAVQVLTPNLSCVFFVWKGESILPWAFYTQSSPSHFVFTDGGSGKEMFECF